MVESIIITKSNKHVSHNSPEYQQEDCLKKTKSTHPDKISKSGEIRLGNFDISTSTNKKEQPGRKSSFHRIKSGDTSVLKQKSLFQSKKGSSYI